MIITALRSLATYVAVSVYVLIVAPPGMLLAIVFGWKDLLYILGHWGVRLGLALSGITFKVAGASNVPGNRAAVYCSNHESNVDPPIVFEALHPRLHILYKAELNRIPVLARAFRLGGFIPIERQNRESSMRSIEAGAASIRSGNSFLIFPEGTRSRTGQLLPFKKGGFLMAIRAQAPIVPVAVQGGRAAMHKGSWVIRPVTVTLRVGEPIETAGLTQDDRQDLIDRVHQRIASMLEEGPIEEGHDNREGQVAHRSS